MIKLDILSDPICPWCFIGKARLDQALINHPDHPFAIEWHPFQLNPTMPAGGMDRREYLETKFGGRANALKVYGAIAEAAEESGLEIDFAAIKRTPNTLDAHRLIHWAGIEGRQTAVVTALFKAYFQEGKDIEDPATLRAIAEGAEMDGDMIARLLASDADRADIIARDSHARQRGVNSVPTFIVANTHVVPGAQPPELWEQVIAELSGAPQDATVN
ncbi:MAG: DsbA family oxidoreductase [Rhodovulum sp.]|nr:polyketide biosynthesis protein [Rhodovulum sp.]MCI5086628.1 DsbA family oxidoreductase [Rhodovulum sp.]